LGEGKMLKAGCAALSRPTRPYIINSLRKLTWWILSKKDDMLILCPMNIATIIMFQYGTRKGFCHLIKKE
jgi:hypothetical protein